MKQVLHFLLFLLLAGALQAQATYTYTLTGTVTSAADGSPVPNWPVQAFTDIVSNDSTLGGFGFAYTDANGFYTITIASEFPSSSLSVITQSNCDPSGPPAFATAPLINNQAQADFQVCTGPIDPIDTTGWDCYAWVDFQQLDSLTFQFNPYVYTFDGDSAEIAFIVWDFGDSTTSNEINPVHTYAQDGYYLVSVFIQTTDGCSSEALIAVWTDAPPVPECEAFIYYEQSDSTDFNFYSYWYSMNPDSNQIATYFWDFGDGSTSTEQNPQHNYSEEGVYTVQLTVLSPDSCQAFAETVVLAYNCPIDTFWYGCQAMFYINFPFDSLDPSGGGNFDPYTIQFIDQSLGTVVSWNWNFGDGATSGEQNPTHTYTADGIYTVTLDIVTADGCQSSIAFEIYIGTDPGWVPEFDCQAMFIPLPDSIGGSGIQFIDVSYTQAPIQSWSWDFGDGTTSTEQNPYHVYSQAGIYTVSLTITADSCNSAISFNIDTENPWNFSAEPAILNQSGTTSSTHDPVAFPDLRLFPNPVENDLSVAFSGKVNSEILLSIRDLSGRTLLVQSQPASAGPNVLRVPTSGLLPGVYFLELRSDQQFETRKFVKQ